VEEGNQKVCGVRLILSDWEFFVFEFYDLFILDFIFLNCRYVHAVFANCVFVCSSCDFLVLSSIVFDGFDIFLLPFNFVKSLIAAE